MKLKKIIYKKIVWVLVLVFCMSFVSCTGDGVYTVSFDYGYGDKVLTEDVSSGTSVTKPDEPMRIGYEFDGWWIKDEDGERLWDFEKDVVTKDLTLYARWVDSSEKPYTIKLDPNGGVCEFDEIEVFYGKEYSLPIPTKEGYYFFGWGMKSEGIYFGNENMKVTAKWRDYPPGMIVKMGRFEQDNDLSNGLEEIEWQVIKHEDGKYFLISRYILTAMKYSTSASLNCWEDSIVRAWLNKDFFEKSFNSEEKKYILNTQTEEIITDKIFCLSYEEISSNIEEDAIVYISPTPYALSKGLVSSGSLEHSDGTIELTYPYFLDSGKYVTTGNNYGWGNAGNFSGVRPAMWISEEYLESLSDK